MEAPIMDKTPLAREEALVRPKPIALLGLTVGFVSLAVGTPYAVHMLGGQALGQTFLPMHFFILFSGLLLGWQSGLAAGILTPFISFSLSGMPPLPILLPLTLEMSVYGLVAGLMANAFRKNVWLSLGMALVCGRIVLVASLLALKMEGPFSYLASSVSAGLPGIVIQVVLLPVMVKLVRRRAADNA
jgi:hypothetical protein